MGVLVNFFAFFQTFKNRPIANVAAYCSQGALVQASIFAIAISCAANNVLLASFSLSHFSIYRISYIIHRD